MSFALHMRSMDATGGLAHYLVLPLSRLLPLVLFWALISGQQLDTLLLTNILINDRHLLFPSMPLGRAG